MEKRRLPGAGRAAAAAALAVACFLALNLAVSRIGGALDLDLSRTNIYQISQVSRDFLAGLDREVEIRLIASEPDRRIVKFLEKYTKLSDCLTWTQTDPLQDPGVLSAYEGAQDGCVAVTCPETGLTRIIASDEIIQYDLAAYAYYGEYKETFFDADSCLTNAIHRVITGSAASVWTLRGHGETDLPARVRTELEKAGFQTEERDLLRVQGGIEADLVLLNAPARDLSADEARMLSDYVRGGGHVIVLRGAAGETETPELDALCAGFGIAAGNGVVRDEGNYYQNSYLIFPELDTGSEITQYVAASDAGCLLYRAAPLELTGTDGVKVSALLSGGQSAEITFEEGAPRGAGGVCLGAIAECGEGGGFLAVLPDSLIGETLLDNYGNLGNLTVFLNAAAYGIEETAAYAIPPVSLASTHNATRNTSVYGVIFIGVIPAAVLCAGFVCWLRRRNR